MRCRSAALMIALCCAAGCGNKVTFDPNVLATSHGCIKLDLPAGAAANKKSGELHFLNGRVWYVIFMDATDDVLETRGIEVETTDLGENAKIKHSSEYAMKASIMDYASAGVAAVKDGTVKAELLRVDGKRYDLSKGRVFLCRFAKSRMRVKQLPLHCKSHTILKAIREESTDETDAEDRARETARAREIGRALIARHVVIGKFLNK